MNTKARITLGLLSALAGILTLSSFFPGKLAPEPTGYTGNNRQQTSSGSIRLTAGFENDYYCRNQRQGHFYAEVQTGAAYAGNWPDLPMNLSIVIDRSGSMSGQKIQYARTAAKHIVDQLGPEDYLSVVMYDQVVEVVYPAGRVESPSQIKSRIDRITDRGSTNLMGGAMKGYDEVRKNYRPGYINRVLLLSDGLANEGITSPTEIERIVRRKMQDEGISISTFGVGRDYNEDLMTNMAESGNGNYYFINEPRDIAGIFEKELNGLSRIVAQQAVMQIRLPEGVTVEKVFGSRYTQSGRTLSIPLHDLFASETRGVLIRYTNPYGERGDYGFETSLRYREPGQGPQRILALSNICRFTGDYAQYDRSYSEWVSGQVVLYESNARMEDAMKEVDRGNYDEARKKVRENKDYLKSKAPLVEKSVELQRTESVTENYEGQIKAVEAMPVEDVKYMQKATKNSNYELRTKKH